MNKYLYRFRIRRDGKLIVHKTSIHLDKMIKFRDEWIKENPEHFS